MTILDRYLAAALGQGFLLVLLMLLPLFTFLDLIQQLDDVGTGVYGFWEAIRFEFQMLPRRALDLLPFIALMGSSIALAMLAHHSELIAMQASGISIARVAGAVLKSGLVLMLLAVALEEFVASPLHQRAVQQRSMAMTNSVVEPREGGFWIHYGDRFVNINKLLFGQMPADIDIYELGPEQRLITYIHASQADISDPEEWLLQDLIIKRERDGVLVTEQLASMHWESYLTSDQVGLLELPPNAMSPTQSYRYVAYLDQSGQSADRFELALWQKLTLPFTMLVMMLMAIPFAFGSPRLRSVGKRILLALVSGFGFQIVNQVVANLGLIFKLSPPLISLLPVVIALLFAGWLLWREQLHARLVLP